MLYAASNELLFTLAFVIFMYHSFFMRFFPVDLMSALHLSVTQTLRQKNVKQWVLNIYVTLFFSNVSQLYSFVIQSAAE